MKQLTNPTLLDNLNHPLPDGLYDPALGPIDMHSRCAAARVYLLRAAAPRTPVKRRAPLPRQDRKSVV